MKSIIEGSLGYIIGFLIFVVFLDGSHVGDQGGLAPPQHVAPDIKQPSPPGSEKPPTSARSGGQRSMSDRRQSATRRSGR